MSVRATYALDEATSGRIKQMAATLGVSQAEVIRRAVQRAAEDLATTALTPADVVARYAKGSLPRTARQTQRLVAQLRQARHQDDLRRSTAARE